MHSIMWLRVYRLVSISVGGIIKKLFQILGSVAFMGILLIAGAVIYSTVKGYTTWYFRVNGKITVDGHSTSGYMHANTQRTLLLLTRTDQVQPETYLVALEHGKGIVDCGQWHPIRFIPFPIGDVNPPCSAFVVDPATVLDAPLTKSLVLRRRSVEFSTSSGRKIIAEW